MDEVPAAEGLLIVTSRVRIPRDEMQFSFARSSGPGGQNVNKVNTKATLRWPVRNSPSLPADVKSRFLKRYATRVTLEGELVISSQRFRSQGKNVDDCFEKLAEMLAAVAAPPVKRKPTRPSAGSKERRLQAKRAQSQRKQRRSGAEW